jgi:hypothetical protein
MSKRPVANTARQLALNDPDELAVFAQLLWDAASVAGTMGVPPPWQDKVKEIVNAVMRDEYRDAVRIEIRRVLQENHAAAHREATTRRKSE